MPSVPIDSNINASGKLDKADAMHGGQMKYVAPHERKDGPWDDYELDEMGHHCSLMSSSSGTAAIVASNLRPLSVSNWMTCGESNPSLRLKELSSTGQSPCRA